ncbi:hypothetical protein SKAU_G00018200 [Synaphobranchus kaupii]|uniref:Uncharacterized protein n=1 Tax=Synaphobranchus kaupii TaxID=118154 RepID=A0A9Q1JE18_SYNKA|nr:hypothetical protein SKAU_G00018200 [Synaphobranchus kaupii]
MAGAPRREEKLGHSPKPSGRLGDELEVTLAFQHTAKFQQASKGYPKQKKDCWNRVLRRTSKLHAASGASRLDLQRHEPLTREAKQAVTLGGERVVTLSKGRTR